MVPIVVVFLIAIVGYLLACTVTAMKPAEVEFAEFIPDTVSLVRIFSDSPQSVQSAYTKAAAELPGMAVIRRTSQSILIDMKPSVLAVDGSCGVLLLALFSKGELGTIVSVMGQKRVRLPWIRRSDAAFVRAEQSLRMSAKQAGISEVVTRF